MNTGFREKLLQPFLCVGIAMGATRPAAWSPLAIAKIFETLPEPLLPCLRFLCGLDPANPLVPSDRCDVFPCPKRVLGRQKRFLQIMR